MSVNAKTSKEFWDDTWIRKPRLRIPSGLFVGTRNIQKILASYISPGMQVLEIGCAPGKILSWVAKNLGAEVSGIDFSARGIDNAILLFQHLGITGNLKYEDIYETTFEEGKFDCVFSCGMIEHFNDPKQLIEMHVKLTKSGGKAIMVIPNLAGIYGRLQRYFDPEVLSWHNLRIMNPASLISLAPMHLVTNVRSYFFGRAMAMFTTGKKLPKIFAHALCIFLNVIGHLQPVDIKSLCPLIVLEITRRECT